MNFTKDQQIVMLHDAARASGMDDHIVSEPPPGTMAERVMTWFGGRKNTPRKNSYLYLDSVDACFFYSNIGVPTVTLTARWSCGAKDLDRLADAAVARSNFPEYVAALGEPIRTMGALLERLAV